MPRKKKEAPVIDDDLESRGAGETEIQPVPFESITGLTYGEPSNGSDRMADLDERLDPEPSISVPSDSTPVDPESSRRPKYPHLENLARYDTVLSCKRVTVQEKLDGANVRFGLDRDGQLWAGSRNQVLDLSDRSASYGFVGWLLDSGLAERLEALSCRGIVYFGEWVGRKVQGRIKYANEGFYLFDILIPDHDDEAGVTHYTLATASHVDWHASQLRLAQVPRLYWGKPDLSTLQRLRDKPYLSDLTEGIVIKADPPQRDFRGDWIIAKFKSPAFEEVAKAKKKEPRPPLDAAAAEEFVGTYVTLERMRHVFQQVREQGEDPTDVRNTGLILKTMHADIVREGLEDYRALDQTQQKHVGKVHVPVTKALIDELVAAEQKEAA